MTESHFRIYCGLVAVWLTYRLIRGRGRVALPVRSPHPVPWSTADVAVVVVLYFILLLTCDYAMQTFRIEAAFPFERATMIDVVCRMSVNIAAVFYVFQVVFRVRDASSEALGLSSRELVKNCRRGIAAYLMCCPILILSSRLVNHVLKLEWIRDFLKAAGFGLERQTIVSVWERMESWPLILTLSIFAVVIAPVTEEIFFRGFLQQAIRRRRGEFASIAITALIFAAVHMNLRFFVPLALLGGLLSYLFARTGTLAAPLLVHALHNAVMIGRLLLRKP